MQRVLYCIVSLIFFGQICNAASVRLYEENIGPFDKIKLLDNVNVIYSCLPDSTGFIRFEGKPEFEDAFILKISDNGTLKIQVNTEDVGKPDLPVLHIYSDFLTSVENSSNKDIIINNIAPCNEFKVSQIGNGSIEVNNVKATKVSASINTGNGQIIIDGECHAANFKMVGAGVISADRLKATTVDCKILGTGSIGCWPIDNLNVKGIGSTKIYYKGKPSIKKTGGGKLFELPAPSASDFNDYSEPDDDD